MNNEMLFNMFKNTLIKMSDNDLNDSLDKAKALLKKEDYESLVKFIEEERKK